jgi:NDP-sugar pyrophosphorylase family protein
MILAAGLGTRLRPLTEQTPKPLLPVAGRPMILYPLALLRRHGITEVIINTHLFPEQFRQVLGDGSELGLRITYSPEPVLLDTGGGLKNAERFFKGETFVAMNADTLIEADLDAALAAHRRFKPLATLVLKKIPDAQEFSAVEVDAAGYIRRLRGEPADFRGAPDFRGAADFRGAPDFRGAADFRGAPDFRGAADPSRALRALNSYTFTGLQILEPEALELLPSNQPSCLIRDAFLPLLRQGRELRAFITSGYWKSLDTADRIHEAEADLQAGQIKVM